MKKLSLILLGFLGTGLIAMDPPSPKKTKTDFTFDVGTRFTVPTLQELAIRSRLANVFNITDTDELANAEEQFKKDLDILTIFTKDLAMKEYEITRFQNLFNTYAESQTPRDQKLSNLSDLLDKVKKYNAKYRDRRLHSLESRIMRTLNSLRTRTPRGIVGRQLILPPPPPNN